MIKPECISEKLEHKGKILTFYSKEMKFESGNTAMWDFIHHNGAAAVVAVDNDGKLLMVRQYRPGCDRFTLEIPAGCLNANETRAEAAARELEEETGYKCNKIELLNKFYPAAAYDDEYIEIYLATDFTKTHQNLDPDEEVEIFRYDLDTLVNMIINAEIADGKTIAGIMTYYARVKENKI